MIQKIWALAVRPFYDVTSQITLITKSAQMSNDIFLYLLVLHFQEPFTKTKKGYTK